MEDNGKESTNELPSVQDQLGVTDELLKAKIESALVDEGESSKLEMLHALAEHVCFHEYDALPFQLIDYLKYAVTSYLFLNAEANDEGTAKLLKAFDDNERQHLIVIKAKLKGKEVTLDQCFDLATITKQGRPRTDAHKDEKNFLAVKDMEDKGMKIKEAIEQVFGEKNPDRLKSRQQEYSRWKKTYISPELQNKIVSDLLAGKDSLET